MRLSLSLALLASLTFEACTYHSSINHFASHLGSYIGIENPQAATITIAMIAMAKLITICLLINTSRTRSNLLVILLAMCALADCFLVALFLNAGMYAILINISDFFGDVYRAVEAVCIVSILFDVVCILLSSTVLFSARRNRNESGGSIRGGDKV